MQLDLRTWIQHHYDACHLGDILEGMLQGVRYLHELEPPLVHCDLKPENLLLSFCTETQRWIVKVADFGLVSIVGGPWKPTVREGTLTYRAPERAIAANELTPAADIYSLGIILHELLHPFSTEMERARTLDQLKRGELPAAIPILHEMLHTDPTRRPTIVMILAELHDYYNSDEHLVAAAKTKQK
jgi:serine/threonine protein kinase